MKGRLLLTLFCALVTLTASALPASAVTPVVVVHTDQPELGPAASTTYLAWFVFFPTAHPYANLWAEPIGSDTPFRVNPSHTSAFTGGIDGSTLVYQLSEPRDAKPDIAMIDLSTKAELDVPDGVNTPRSEFAPSISGTHILFGRGIREGSSVVLFDISTGTSQVLYSKTNTDKKSFDILPIQVNGNYAVWQQVVSDAHGRLLGGDVWRYDIAAGTTTKIPNAEGVWQYGPSVNSAGTVFFGRSNLQCGKNAQLIERKLDGSETPLYTFPDGQDFSFSGAVDNVDGTTDVYFDQGSCSGADFGDIWRLPGI